MPAINYRLCLVSVETVYLPHDLYILWCCEIILSFTLQQLCPVNLEFLARFLY